MAGGTVVGVNIGGKYADKKRISLFPAFPSGELVKCMLDARKQLNANGYACLSSSVYQNGALYVLLPQSDKVSKRDAAKLEDGSGHELCLLHLLSDHLAVEQLVKLVHVEGTLVMRVNPCVHFMEKSRLERGNLGIHATVIDASEHAQIGGDRIGRGSLFFQVLLVGFEQFGSNGFEKYMAAFSEFMEGMQGMAVDMRGRVAPLLLEKINVGCSHA